jgi:hypothetical protein
VKHWRVTKYNPAYRDKDGAYRRDDWTSFDDIGREFSGRVLAMTDYMLVENSYVSSAIYFANESGIKQVVASELEIRETNLKISEGMSISIDNIPEVIRDVLRCHIWCKLELQPLFYLHFGYDYYMYIGNVVDLPGSAKFARACGLFVEDFASPYLLWDDIRKDKH